MTESQQSLPIDLDNKEFQNVWNLIRFTNQSVFMTGRAGAGKSTFLKYITEHTRKRHVILAPTGIAAVNVGGMTMHSFFKLPFKPLLPDDPDFAGDRLRKRLAYSKSKIKLIREIQLIVIDEISMVRADIIDFIDRILRTYSGNTRQPFGGKQMLFVGDIFQLEPVVTADMREALRHYYPQPYFFAANVFKEFAIVPVELRKIYRQRDPAFLAMLERIRTGTPTEADVAALNSRCDIPGESGQFTMTLATRRDTVEQINQMHLAGLTTPEVTYTGSITDDFPENSLPSPLLLTLKVGAQVVFLRNDRDKRWVNGTVGKVTALAKDEIEVELESGNRYGVSREIWEHIDYKYDEKEKKITENLLGTYTQFPVNLAWALTIHKSQGLTFNNVIIDARGAFTGGQTYVALSRCTSLEGITLKTPIQRRDVFVNQAIVDFSHNFNDPALIESALEQAKADAAYNEASKAFDNGNYSLAVEKLAEGVNARNELKRPSALRLLKRKMSRLSRAEEKIAELSRRLAEDEEKFRRLAMEYVAMGKDCLYDGCDPTAAIANFDKAISIMPECAAAVIAKAEALLDCGVVSDATASLDRIGDFRIFTPEEVSSLARKLVKAGDAYRAIDMLLSLVPRNKNSVTLYKALADVYDKVGDEDSSEMYRQLAARAAKRRR